MTVFIIDQMSLKTKQLLMLHCQKVDIHTYVCHINERIRKLLWKNILKDPLAKDCKVVYNYKCDQGYAVKSKSRSQSLENFDGLVLANLR